MRLCSTPGCTGPAVSRNRCRDHAREANRKYTSVHKPKYNSKKWTLTRRRKLFRTPICEHPDCDRLAVDVHHANGHEDFFNLDGLEALCKEHHGEVTRAEQLGQAA